MSGFLDLYSGYQAANPYSNEDFASALAQANQVYQQQQQLGSTLLAQSQGQGPNPALNQLKQTTDQNNQQAAGLLASQRGLNPALAARMAAQTQTTANQQAGGQAATLGAEQALQSQNQLQNLYASQGKDNLSQQGLMTQAGESANQINAGVANQNAQTNQKMIGGLMNGLGGVGTALLSQGGKVGGHPVVSGDSTKNDTVPTMLSPGEIVIPRSHAKNSEMAKEFIDALMSRNKKKASSQNASFGKVLDAHRKLTEALKAVSGK